MAVRKKGGGGVTAEYFREFPICDSGEFNYSSRIEFMLKHSKISEKLEEWVKTNEGKGGEASLVKNPGGLSLPPGKDLELATQLREAGNAEYKKKPSSGLLLTSALEKYNSSLLFAPVNSPAFSLALGNRSAVYLEMAQLTSEYPEDLLRLALSDAQAAVSSPAYPKPKDKMSLRIASILSKLGRFQEAQETLEKFEFVGCSEETLKRVEELSDLLKKGQDEGKNLLQTPGRRREFHSSDDFVNACPEVRLEWSEAKGRFVSGGNSGLRKGTVLFEEKPFASVLLPQFVSTHCSYCHVPLKHLYFYPCYECTQVKFCSASCGLNAWEQFHRWECGSLDFLHGVGISHLAVRVALIAGKDRILRVDLAGDAETSLEGSRRLFRATGDEDTEYLRVWSLVDHLKEMKEPEDLFQYALSASLLTLWLLRKTKFFGKYLSTQDIPSEAFAVGGAVLKHICQLICNAHAITDLVYEDNEFVKPGGAGKVIKGEKVGTSTADSTQERIASAIYPSASMMNHSCDHNVAFGFVEGSKLVVRLTCDLDPSEEIFNCYGPHYRRMGVGERQEILREQYFFKCDCGECRKEIKGGVCFVDRFEGFKCKGCGAGSLSEKTGRCGSCGWEVDEETVECAKYADSLMEDAEVLLERGKVKEALGLLEKCQRDRSEVLSGFHKEIGRGNDLIGKCYAMLGNFDKSVEHVRLSLAYVGLRFGLESFEYAREAKKLSELLRKLSEINGDNKYSNEICALTKVYTEVLRF